MIDNETIALINLEDHIKGDSTLDYVEAREIRKFDIRDLPQFKDCAVIISPKAKPRQFIAQDVEEPKLEVMVRCVVRIQSDKRAAVVGETPGNVGIMKLVRDVEASLFRFFETYADDLEYLGDEMENDVDYENEEHAESDLFFYIVPVPVTIRLKPKIH
jgi:hypothetical protein